MLQNFQPQPQPQIDQVQVEPQSQMVAEQPQIDQAQPQIDQAQPQMVAEQPQIDQAQPQMGAPITKMVPEQEEQNINDKRLSFELKVKELHDKYMNLPDKISKINYGRLYAIIDQLLNSYLDYLTPNVEFMVDNMKRKLELINPSGELQKKSQQFFDDLQEYLKSFYNSTISFSKFKNNDRELNEQFNIVLHQLIDNLKNGNKIETVSLVKLLRKLIDEIMKRHSIKGEVIDKTVFLDRLKELTTKPIQIITGNKDDSPKPIIDNMTNVAPTSGIVEKFGVKKNEAKFDISIPNALNDAALKNKIDEAVKSKDIEIQTLKNELKNLKEIKLSDTNNTNAINYLPYQNQVNNINEEEITNMNDDNKVNTNVDVTEATNVGVTEATNVGVTEATNVGKNKLTLVQTTGQTQQANMTETTTQKILKHTYEKCYSYHDLYCLYSNNLQKLK